MIRRCLFLGASLWFSAGLSSLRAHETWLLPTSFTAPAGGERGKVAIDLTSGMLFPEPEHAIDPDRVALARCRLGGRTAVIEGFERLDHTLRLAPSFERAGLATIWIQLKPKTLELTSAQVEEYFAEIGATDEVREQWARVRGTEPWKETYTKHAKTFVAVGTGPDDSWREPAGLPFEIVPLDDPFALRTGEEAGFRLLRRGQPLARASLGLIVEGVADRVLETTDEDGRASFALEQPGRILLSAVDLRRSQERPEWESDFTTLVLEVAPE